MQLSQTAKEVQFEQYKPQEEVVPLACIKYPYLAAEQTIFVGT